MINKTNINKVLNKLPQDKVELEKVELAIVDDVKKMTDQCEAKIKEIKQYEKDLTTFKKSIDAIYKQGDKIKSGADKVYASSNKLYFKAVSVIEKAENAAKSLGVSVSDVKGVAKLLQVTEQLDVEGVELDSKVADVIGELQ